MNFEIEDTKDNNNKSGEITRLSNNAAQIKGPMSPKKLEQIIDMVSSHPAKVVILNTVGAGFSPEETEAIERVRGEIEARTGKTVKLINTDTATGIHDMLAELLDDILPKEERKVSDTYPLSESAARKAFGEFADALQAGIEAMKENPSLLAATAISSYVASVMCGLESGEGARNENSVIEMLSGKLANATTNAFKKTAADSGLPPEAVERAMELLRWSMGAMAAVIVRAQHFTLEEQKGLAAEN